MKQEEKKPAPAWEFSKEETLLLKAIQSLSTRYKSLKEYFGSIIDTLLPAWPFPVPLYMEIVYKKIAVQTGNYPEVMHTIRQDLSIRNKQAGYIKIGYPEKVQEKNTAPFLEKVRKLLQHIGSILESIIEKRNSELTIQKLTLRLKEKSKELEKKNLALTEILAQIENEKKIFNDKIQANIKKLITPVINKLKSDNLTEETRKQYVGILEGNLYEISSSFADKITREEVKLSPRELEICNLITNGFHTKEIAQVLQISILTVERHRFNIRKKMGIRKHQVNLQSFLQKY